jgi:fatty-acyl-CoA synthase
VRGTQLQIVDDDGVVVTSGEVGRIVVRGASPFDGYTSGVSKEFLDDFMVTGDVGRLDDSGLLHVVGRDDDMIVSGGENVYPIEVEKALGTHDAVHEVVVVGVPDEDFGQRLAAYVVPHGDVDESTLKDHVRSQLAGYKVPRDVVFLDELPRNPSGKVMVRDLPGVEP